MRKKSEREYSTIEQFDKRRTEKKIQVRNFELQSQLSKRVHIKQKKTSKVSNEEEKYWFSSESG
jgi:hypothetical protein